MKTKTRKLTKPEVVAAVDDQPREFMNKEEIAREFGITTRTIDDWMRRRLISFTKIGRCVRFHWPSIKQDLTNRSTVKAA